MDWWEVVKLQQHVILKKYWEETNSPNDPTTEVQDNGMWRGTRDLVVPQGVLLVGITTTTLEVQTVATDTYR